jgi:hypothetical protein
MKRRRKKHTYSVKKKYIVGSIVTMLLMAIIIANLSIELVKGYKQNHFLKEVVQVKERKIEDLKLEAAPIKYLTFMTRLFREKYPQMAKIGTVSFTKGEEYEMSPYLILSIIQVESAFKPTARSSVAYGLMQINYHAWKKDLEIDLVRIFDVEYNIDLGCRVYKYYLKVAKGDVLKALFYYNNGASSKRPFKANERYGPEVQKALFNPKKVIAIK